MMSKVLYYLSYPPSDFVQDVLFSIRLRYKDICKSRNAANFS